MFEKLYEVGWCKFKGLWQVLKHLGILYGAGIAKKGSGNEKSLTPNSISIAGTHCRN